MLAYFDCVAGISGDMTLAAFVDLGVPVEWLQETLESAPLAGFRLSAGPIHKSSIHAVHLNVEIASQTSHRHYTDICKLIDNSPFSEAVKAQSRETFRKIAEAEAAIHGIEIDKVHFHEVGAVDSLVDIIGSALCVEYLGIEKVIASKIPLGSGMVKCQHGTLPSPAPATLAILKGVPVRGIEINGETVTPTGAAIITTLAERFGQIPEMRIEKIGYGAGRSNFDPIPNILRILLGHEDARTVAVPEGCEADEVMVLETNIDDMNPEIFGFVMERLFEAGALDVCWIPVYMKKNRPGTLVQVLCPESAKAAVIKQLLSETTATGLRYHAMARIKLKRETLEIKTPFGPVAVKRIQGLDGRIRITPEYDTCREIARTRNISLQTVYDTILRETDPPVSCPNSNES